MEGNNPMLTESRVMTFYADPKLRYFDVDITLTALVPVTFGDGKDGALGINQMPFGLDRLLAGEEGFHGKRGQEQKFSGGVSTPVFRGKKATPAARRDG